MGIIKKVMHLLGYVPIQKCEQFKTITVGLIDNQELTPELTERLHKELIKQLSELIDSSEYGILQYEKRKSYEERYMHIVKLNLLIKNKC